MAHSASAEGQSRKFFFLKGKIKNGKGAPKNEWKNFLLCSPQGECRRWAGSASVRAQIVAQRKFERRSVIATLSVLYYICNTLQCGCCRLVFWV